jgi:Cellulase (glycosyl hydrolase family 5)
MTVEMTSPPGLAAFAFLLALVSPSAAQPPKEAAPPPYRMAAAQDDRTTAPRPVRQTAKAIIEEMLSHPGFVIQNNYVWSGQLSEAEIDDLARQKIGFVRLDGFYDPGDFSFSKINANWKAAFLRFKAKHKIVIVGTGLAWAENGKTDSDDRLIASLPHLVEALKALGADPARTIIKFSNEWQRYPDAINAINARAYKALRGAGWTGPIMISGGPWRQDDRHTYYSWAKGISFLDPPASGAEDPLLFLEWHDYAPEPFTTQGTADYPAKPIASVSLDRARYRAAIEAVFSEAAAVTAKTGLYTVNAESGVPSGAAHDNERALVLEYHADMAKKYGIPIAFFAVTLPAESLPAPWYRATWKTPGHATPQLLPSVEAAIKR